MYVIVRSKQFVHKKNGVYISVWPKQRKGFLTTWCCSDINRYGILTLVFSRAPTFSRSQLLCISLQFGRDVVLLFFWSTRWILEQSLFYPHLFWYVVQLTHGFFVQSVVVVQTYSPSPVLVLAALWPIHITLASREEKVAEKCQNNTGSE